MFWAIERSSSRPGALAVLGHEKDAGLDRIGRGRRSRTSCAVERDAAARGPVDAEQDPGEFGTSGADQAGEAEDLAGVEVEIDLAARDRWTCAGASMESTTSPPRLGRGARSRP